MQRCAFFSLRRRTLRRCFSTRTFFPREQMNVVYRDFSAKYLGISFTVIQDGRTFSCHRPFHVQRQNLFLLRRLDSSRRHRTVGPETSFGARFVQLGPPSDVQTNASSFPLYLSKIIRKRTLSRTHNIRARTVRYSSLAPRTESPAHPRKNRSQGLYQI